MFDRFTGTARHVAVRARDEARELGHPYIGTEHVLLALLDPGSGVTAQILGAVIDRDRVLADIDRLCGSRIRVLDAADAEALRTIGIDLDAVIAAVERSFGPGALLPPPPAARRRRLSWRARRRRRALRRHGIPAGHVPFTPRTKEVLELSLRESLRLKQNHISSEHILLGLLREGEGLAARILVDAGLTLEDLRGRTLRALDAA